MEWLNYHHLFYFWTVAREGSVAAASRQLHVGRPAISMQLKSLEKFVGAELFRRRGRYLELTKTGELVQTYADDIFSTGRELVDVLRGPSTHPQSAETLSQALRHGTSCLVQLSSRRRSGEEFASLVAVRPFADAQRHPRFAIALLLEVPAGRPLRELVEKLTKLMKLMPFGPVAQ